VQNDYDDGYQGRVVGADVNSLEYQRGEADRQAGRKHRAAMDLTGTYNAGKKRLFYLFPANGDFLLKLVFNDRALEEIRGENFPKYIGAMIREAKKYSEGTLCEFTRKNLKVATMLELLRIKIST